MTSADSVVRAAVAGALDYKALGFRCGLEIHQQLATRKLFSPCPSDVVEPDEVKARTTMSVERRLRATGGETGEVDVAAAAEARKQRTYRYLAIDGLTSLVELDEEPPHPLAPDALDVSLTFAGLVGSMPVAELEVMRKTVIDGSNTSGFQRTALLATGGRVDVEGGPVRLQTLTLEEDSARKLAEADGVVTYTLDRLGIPLLEIATETDIHDPEHAKRTAARLGALLRATGRVKRGLGTIRQDLNVSIRDGARVEVKGCQDLRAIPRIIEGEVRRQLWMHQVAQQIKKRGPPAAEAPEDVTHVFASNQGKMVRDALQRGHHVFGVRLPHAAGLLKGEAKEGPRLGRELADHARIHAGVKGIFHSDELPGYGITDAEVAATRSALRCGSDDGFALCVEAPATAASSLSAAAARYAQALHPQKEVRAVQPDDSTRYLRPMPGAARMYPETDVPPTRITAAMWEEILARLPPTPEKRAAHVVAAHKVSQDVAEQLVAEGLDDDFVTYAKVGADASVVARVLLQTRPALKHEARVAPHLPTVFSLLAAGRFAKEAVEPILRKLDEGASSVDDAIAQAGAGAADAAEVDRIIAAVVQERLAFVRERGAASIGPLMGPVMAKLRGKADGALISERLRLAVEKALR